MKPAVSVIMPALNMAPWIRESIDSILAQSCGDWELIVVDDGSTDEGPDIVSAYSAEDARIRMVRHADGGSHGASASRNLGLEQARGAFIALLDADDVWHENKLQDQLEIMRLHPDIGVVYGRTEWWHSWQERATERDEIPQLGLRAGEPMPGHVLLERFIRNAVQLPCTCSVLMRRSAVELAGGFVDEFRYVYTDQVFFAKLFLATKALPVDRCWDRYRRRRDSSSSLTPAELREARLRFLDWLTTYLQQHGMDRLPIARTARSEIRWTSAPASLQRVRRFINRIPGRLQRLRDALRPADPPSSGHGQ
jgi:glycosyltransferase involved in cell wall biosynthesis